MKLEPDQYSAPTVNDRVVHSPTVVIWFLLASIVGVLVAWAGMLVTGILFHAGLMPTTLSYVQSLAVVGLVIVPATVGAVVIALTMVRQ